MITPNFKAVNFGKEIRGRRLNGSVIRETEVDLESSCRLQCVEENGCLSYNFGPSENKKKFKCQLSNSDRFVGLKNFTEDHKFLYRGIKVISFDGIKIVSQFFITKCMCFMQSRSSTRDFCLCVCLNVKIFLHFQNSNFADFLLCIINISQ